MKIIRDKRKLIVRNLLLCLSVISLFFLGACECLNSNERADMLVFAGDRTSEDCKSLLKNNAASHPDITYVCKGEKVTICWSSSNISGFELVIGGASHSVASSGSEVIAIDATTDIILKPVGAKCAGSRTFTVKVVNGPTPSSWVGRWGTCGKIFFEINEAFISRNIIAKDITANWYPVVQITSDKGETSNVTCTYPPFLLSEHAEEAYGFEIKQPFVTVPFSRSLKAVGHWNFTWKAECPLQDQYICLNYAVFPFNVTLDCP